MNAQSQGTIDDHEIHPSARVELHPVVKVEGLFVPIPDNHDFPARLFHAGRELQPLRILGIPLWIPRVSKSDRDVVLGNAGHGDLPDIADPVVSLDCDPEHVVDLGSISLANRIRDPEQRTGWLYNRKPSFLCLLQGVVLGLPPMTVNKSYVFHS